MTNVKDYAEPFIAQAHWHYDREHNAVVAGFDDGELYKGMKTFLEKFGKGVKTWPAPKGETILDFTKIEMNDHIREIAVRGDYNIQKLVRKASRMQSDALILAFKGIDVPGAEKEYEKRLQRKGQTNTHMVVTEIHLEPVALNIPAMRSFVPEKVMPVAEAHAGQLDEEELQILYTARVEREKPKSKRSKVEHPDYGFTGRDDTCGGRGGLQGKRSL